MPYGFDFTKPVSRLEEALHVIRLLWDSDGPVDFDGQFYRLRHARLDTEPYEGRVPPIWIGASGGARWTSSGATPTAGGPPVRGRPRTMPKSSRR